MNNFVLTYRERNYWNISCTTCHLILADFESEEMAVKSWNDFSRQIDTIMLEKYAMGYEQGKRMAMEEFSI